MLKSPRNFFPSGTWLSCWILLSQHHSKCQNLIRWSLFPDFLPHFSITRHGEFGRWGGGKGSCTGSLRRELDWKWLLWSMIVAKPLDNEGMGKPLFSTSLPSFPLQPSLCTPLSRFTPYTCSVVTLKLHLHCWEAFEVLWTFFVPSVLLFGWMALMVGKKFHAGPHCNLPFRHCVTAALWSPVSLLVNPQWKSHSLE